MWRIQHLIKRFLVLFAIMVIMNIVAYGQNSVSLDGNYKTSISFIAISNNKFVVSKSHYECYGQPHTHYQYIYKLKEINDSTISLQLLTSKITSGPKKFKGCGKLSVKSLNPRYNGKYTIRKMSNDEIILVGIENSRSISLSKINRKT